MRQGDKPVLMFADEIAAEMNKNSWHAHLSMSHARTHATAVVVLEQL
jgi:phosphopantetheinyl transferase (holo-ACP synthase)